LRSRATAALRQEKAARDAALTPTWAKATDAYMDAIGEVTAHLDNSMTLIDPVVDRLLLVKQSAWLTRATVGQTILSQFSSILANKSWTAPDGIDFADLRGRSQAAWGIVRNLSANAASPALAQAIRDAEPDMSGELHDERNNVAARLLKGEQ